MTDIGELPPSFPETGIGEEDAFDQLAELVRTRSANLGAPSALAHMDPAPAEIAAQLVGLNATVNQNLLHPDLSPFATEAEQRVINWLTPDFGMQAGHMCGGSTLANLTALWCAREHGATFVITSADAHNSIAKCANILQMPLTLVPVDTDGRMDASHLPDLAEAALVLTAGTTGRGVVDDLSLGHGAAWVHVDAAWGGPLRLTKYAGRLTGIERANSVAISAHKWLFQPKDSALVMFADPAVQAAISFGGSYLTTPTIGIQGSRSAAGIALLGTLLAWGRRGLADRIETLVRASDTLAAWLEADPRCMLRQRPETGVVTWRPNALSSQSVLDRLGPTASRTVIDGEVYLRHVAANMHVRLEDVWARIDAALNS